MKYPDYLKENGTIGFVAPSFGCSTEPYLSAFNNALEKFEKIGLKKDLGPNCYAMEGIGISNTPEKCAKELTEYYLSDKNDVIISCGGGELMCEILDYMDFDKIKNAKPKWYMGYSDNTNFTFLLATICDTASIYGPCAASFGMEPWHTSLDDALALLKGAKNKISGYDKFEIESLKDEEHPLVPYNLTETKILKNYIGNSLTDKVSFSGRLIGGCADCLVNLLGTKYDKVEDFNEKYKEDGIIWFLEACDLNVMSIRRAMWQMENAGWFKYVKGFIIGRPAVFGQEMMGLDQYSAVMGVLGKYNVPVIMDADIGHLAPMIPVVSGGYAIVSSEDNNISIEYINK